MWMFLFPCVLLHVNCWLVQSTVSSVPVHLCVHLLTGHLERIHLKSFAHTRPNSVESDLLLFESDQVYWIARSSILSTMLPLQQSSYRWDSIKSYYLLRNLSVPENSGPIESIYVLNNEKEEIYQTILLTAHRELVYNRWQDLLRSQDRVHARYSLVLNEWTHGYVLQVDRDRPEEIVIYDFNYTVLPNSVHNTIFSKLKGYLLDPNKASNQTVPLQLNIRLKGEPSIPGAYYLYRDDSNQRALRFIQRSHLVEQQNRAWAGPLIDPSSRLFGGRPDNTVQPPPGFIHNGIVYLFDSYRGCVYTFPYYADLKSQAQSKTTFLYQRENIPFERFFGCHDKFKHLVDGVEKVKLDGKRCEKDPIWKNHPDLNISTQNSSTLASSIKRTLIIIVIILSSIIFSGTIYKLTYHLSDDQFADDSEEVETTEKKRKKHKKTKSKPKLKKKLKTSKRTPNETTLPATQ